MKKLFIMIIFSLIGSVCYSSEINNYDITTPFKVWLLNNEAKAMSELGLDEMILSKCSSPFSILPKTNVEPKKSEEDLWIVHRNIYSFLNEVQKIYNLAKQFGNSKFSLNVKKARPEVWGYSSFTFNGFSLPNTIYYETRRAYLNTLFLALGLDVKKDIDLSERLREKIRGMKDEEFRLLKEYISFYKALYPTEKTVLVLERFITQGSQKPFATGLNDMVKQLTNLSKDKSSGNGSDDPLAELESLTDSKVEEEVKPVTQMEAADPGAAEMYDIW